MVDFFRVQSLEQALAHLEAFRPVGEEQVSLEDALDRILCRSITSIEDLPPFPRSTMDGFAVRAQDTFGATEGSPALMRLTGESRMGEIPDIPVHPNEAVRIATGAMLPDGADAVVMLEYTESLDTETLEVYRTVAPGENVVKRGEDLAKGEKILPAGWPLRPQDIGLLAAMGVARPWVHRRPVVAILSTGDEVVPLGTTPSPGQIRDTNGPALATLVRREGGVPLNLGVVQDERDRLETKIREGLERSDCLMLSGGSSVGARDYALEVIRALDGAEALAHGLAVKPGKPTLIIRVGEKPLLGLPGHPVSALIIFHIVGRPLMDRLSGKKFPRRSPPVRAQLSRNLASAQGRDDYVRVTLFEDQGQMFAKPVLGSSGLIGNLVRAEGLVRIDSNAEGLEKGEWVEVELLR
jgi:molybdopterin molybdotransferase